jgi:anti-sigma factor RsiW
MKVNVMKPCDWSTRLDAYIDGELHPKIAADVEDHLHACENCRADFAALGRMSRAFDDFFEDRTAIAKQRSTVLVARITAAAAAPLAQAAWHSREIHQINRLSRVVATAAAVVVLAGIGFLQWSGASASSLAPSAPDTVSWEGAAIVSPTYAVNRDQPDQALAEFALNDLGHAPLRGGN